MSIFRKASDLNQIPQTVTKAIFDDTDYAAVDDFESLIKEASSNRHVYEQRVKGFEKAQTESKGYEFKKPEPSRYADLPGGIRRAGYGQRFENEQSPQFAGQDAVRSIAHDNNKYAENLLNNGFSIWDTEFDELENAFDQSQQIHNQQFDRRTAAEKKASAHRAWESEQKSQIRKADVLPYRGLGVCRHANETIGEQKFGTLDDFYAETHDSIRDLIRESNNDRKGKITRKGVDPRERREQWENKESIAVRTANSLMNSSFLAKFADQISLDE